MSCSMRNYGDETDDEQHHISLFLATEQRRPPWKSRQAVLLNKKAWQGIPTLATGLRKHRSLRTAL